ncbi:MAG: CDP-alcohol phosphatidyltransferase family protein [Thermoanaerobaculia bacterium]
MRGPEMPAALRVLAPESDGVPSATPILGLPLARRVALAAQRAGFSEILFEEAPGLAGALAGTAARIVPALAGCDRTGASSAGGPLQTEARPAAPARELVLPSGAIPRIDWLRRRRERPDVEEAPGAGAGLFRLRTARDVGPAERWLLQGLIKDTEGFFSRHFERRVSLAITKRLVRTPVTPNAMTAISVAVGLIAASFFLSISLAWQFAGALLFLLHSILDGCDGELARLKFTESRLGGVLDFWGDNVVHSAVFGCMAIGWGRAAGDLRPLVAGAAAIVGTLGSAAYVYRHAMAPVREGPQFTSVTAGAPTRLSRLADALARRDFIYVVILLSAFGRAHWFLALAAVGAPLFFFFLVAIEVYGRRLGRSLS